MPLMIRLGEITLKSSRTRWRFESILVKNIMDALKREGFDEYSVSRERGRIFIYFKNEDLEEKAQEVLKRVFGITSISRVKETSFQSLEDIVLDAEKYFKKHVEGKLFAVRARRTGEHPFTSMDIARKVGAVLLRYAKGVNLNQPEVEVHIEVRGSKAYFFKDIVKAYGGLPIGSEGKVVALVSGGFDSAVAAWYLLKRGAQVDYVFCNIGGLAHKVGVLSVVKILAEKWSYGYNPRLHIIPFSRIIKEITSKTEEGVFNVILKRFMYRVAEKLAKEHGAKAIVTGESLGQVSSQTLQNLYVSSLAVDLQILRPLIGFDKEEIMAKAREIGTYNASSLMEEYCALYAGRPKTRVPLSLVQREEEKLDVATLVEEAVEKKETVDILSIEAPSIEKLIVPRPPPQSIVIDIRSPEEYKAWHYPGSINIPFMELYGELKNLDKNKVYVLYCETGSISLEAAYIMREKGFEAYSLKKGVRGARRSCPTTR
ncbi:MAG: tRNA 4-thiouridine(8) synthase ThiI [Thermoprotei archaeon]|nr:MAG: tRNA 4-thiouridine(8) synthase ThiI [Thermoprotei archaeon]